jgi:hypothetical protein
MVKFATGGFTARLFVARVHDGVTRLLSVNNSQRTQFVGRQGFSKGET